MRFFCAADSRHRGESVFGTVALIRSWLLIEYPSAWRRDALQGSRLIPESVKQYITELGVDRSLLIRRGAVCAGPLQCFRVDSNPPSPNTRRAELDAYDALPHARFGEPTHELMYAVCTHGRHDKCCAKFGLPVFCAVQDHVGDRAWQCSHVGGDRFAGNVVVFPYGLYYGRVTPEDVPEIVRLSETGQVWLPGYRGRSCFPRAVQVAEYFARRESGLLGINEFQPIRIDRIAADMTRVELRGRTDIHIVEYRTIHDALRARLTCHAEESSDIAQYELLAHRLSA